MRIAEACRELGVSPDADADTVRRAFRTLAQRLHPDVNHAPDAATRFARVRQAYETLTSDRRGEAPGETPGNEPARGRDAWPDDADDILDAMFGTA